MQVPAFFYGSYMDPDVLARFGAKAGAPTRATLWGWRLTFTPHANLTPDENTAVEGVVYEFSHDELDGLYGPDGYVTAYRPVPVMVEEGERTRAAMTFVEEAPLQKPDGNYLDAYLAICEKVGLPKAYIKAVEDEVARVRSLAHA